MKIPTRIFKTAMDILAGYLDKCIEIKEFENQHAKIQQEYNELDHQYKQLKVR
jgi:hypothetical protein